MKQAFCFDNRRDTLRFLISRVSIAFNPMLCCRFTHHIIKRFHMYHATCIIVVMVSLIKPACQKLRLTNKMLSLEPWTTLSATVHSSIRTSFSPR